MRILLYVCINSDSWSARIQKEKVGVLSGSGANGVRVVKVI